MENTRELAQFHGILHLPRLHIHWGCTMHQVNGQSRWLVREENKIKLETHRVHENGRTKRKMMADVKSDV